MIDEKKRYIDPELEIISFECEDIITKSFDENNEDGEDWQEDLI